MVPANDNVMHAKPGLVRFFLLADYRPGSAVTDVIHLRERMSAWHYHTKLLPVVGVRHVHGTIPSVIAVPRVTPESITRIDEMKLSLGQNAPACSAMIYTINVQFGSMTTKSSSELPSNFLCPILTRQI